MEKTIILQRNIDSADNLELKVTQYPQVGDIITITNENLQEKGFSFTTIGNQYEIVWPAAGLEIDENLDGIPVFLVQVVN